MAVSQPSLPQTMTAWTYNRRGTVRDVLTLRNDLPLPTPTPDQLLIRVTHVGLNGGSPLIFQLYPHFTAAPCVPDMDFSGVVVQALAGSGLNVGDEVVGVRAAADLLKANGVLCEYITTSRNMVMPRPKNLSLSKGAGLIACGVTALQACQLPGLKQGDNVLITGGSGGLGSILVQYARAVVGKQGRVVATCSGKNVEMVKGLGADEVVDYTVHKNLSQYCVEQYKGKPFDAIFDIVGDAQLHKNCPEYLAEQGMFVLLGDMKELGGASFLKLLCWIIPAKLERYRPVWLGGVPRKYIMHNTAPGNSDLLTLAEMVDEHDMTVQVDSVWRMEDAKEAYEKLISQRARGKIVIKVDPEAAD